MGRSAKEAVVLPASDRRLLDTKQSCAFLAISHDTLARLRADPAERFPHPLQITQGKQHWAQADLEAWVDRKRKQRDALNRA